MAGGRGCKILIPFWLRLKYSKHRGLGRDLTGMGQLPPDSATGRRSIGDGFRRICATPLDSFVEVREGKAAGRELVPA